ncbi:MAG: ABC transporter substrate-binding protein [Candidatus Tectomicrobia bacterium]|nr:ABC transporter substrate-binding protein [Candidatus Tectomicrobia bacterium]
MVRWRMIPWVAVCVAALLLGAWGLTPASAKVEGKEILIGGLYPVTGLGAEWGEFGLAGTQIAIEEINKAGGINGVPLRLIHYDYESKTAPSIALAKKLATRDKVLMITGPCFSSACEVVFPLLDQMKIVAVSYCSSAPGLSALSTWAFRNTLTSDKQLDTAMKQWVKMYNVKKAVILYNSADKVSTSEGRDLLPVLFKKHNVQLLDSLTFQSGTLDFAAYITKVKGLNPDGIGIGSCYQEGANIMREARKQGLKAAFIGGACNTSPDLIRLGGTAAEGYVGSTAAWLEDPRPKVQAFVKKVIERTGGRRPNYGGFRAYDNIYIIKKIIEEQGVTNKPEDLEKDREKMKKGWASLKNFDGVSGITTMDEVGDGIGEAVALIVRNGKYEKIE